MGEHANDMPNQNGCDNRPANYIEMASEACAAGDFLLSMHLYLAAYEQALADDAVPANVIVTALRSAWELSCELKERSMAEYVFEKLEPYLTGEEIADCAMKLQELALDRLEQYGFSREELEDMAEVISNDFMGGGASVVKVESIQLPDMGAFGITDGVSDGGAEVVAVTVANKESGNDEQEDVNEVAESEETADDLQEEQAQELAPEESDSEDPTVYKPAKKSKPSQVDMSMADVNSFNPYDEFKNYSVGTSYYAATTEGSGAYSFTLDEDRANAADLASKQSTQANVEDVKQSQGESVDAEASDHEESAPTDTPAGQKINLSKIASAVEGVKGAGSSDEMPAMPDLQQPRQDGILKYSNLVGYDDAVAIMRDMGVGLQNDAGFKNFVRMLNGRHGLDRMPALDTLLFRSAAIEDAGRFAEATVGELRLPVLRMSMEEGFGGAPVLCVTTQGNNRPRMNHAHNRFEGPGILVIEDLDAWVMPEVPDTPEGFGNFMMSNISRGAREAVSLIRSAVEDPDVFVLATSTTMASPDPFFYELLEPITIVDIGLPTDKERKDIWAEIMRNHPSIRNMDRESLARFSEGLARFDIYMAARDAVEEAYKLGLVQRTYIPVTPQNLYDKLAACQPVDSDRYRAIEEAVVEDFRNDLDHLEDLLGDK